MICAVVLIITLVVFHARRRRGSPVPVQIARVVLAAECIGLVLSVFDYLGGQASFTGALERPENREADTSEELTAAYGGRKHRVHVDVRARELTAGEKEKALDAAEKEVDHTMCGDNRSADRITGDLDLRSSYQGGRVSASWSFDPDELIDADGSVHRDMIAKNTLITVTAELSCGDAARTLSRPVCLIRYAPDSARGRYLALKKSIRSADRASRSKHVFRLPDEIAGMPVHWSRRYGYRGEMLMLLGIAAGVAMSIAAGRQRVTDRRKYEASLDRDYPAIVSELSLYVGAGVSPKNALLRMGRDYEQRSRRTGICQPGYEELLRMCRGLEDGIPEQAAYTGWGEQCGTRSYRKLALMLTQNLRQGNRQLVAMLEREEQDAAEMARMQCRRVGEETSTRLLLPLVGLMGVIMVMMIAPGIISMRM